MKRFFGSAGFLIFIPALAWSATWNPVEGSHQITIWPHVAPNLTKPTPSPEAIEVGTNLKRWGSKPVTGIYQVSIPTMTVYPAKGHHSGAAVVVFPGGGYQQLAIDLEGTEACDWLTQKGIACILLKYRVPASGPHWDPNLKKHVTPKVFTALQDAQRTLGLVRQNAPQWNIDPHKIGVLGFSAGGHLAAAISTNYKKRIYPSVDDADKVACRPDFAILLYPGHLSTDYAIDHNKALTQLNPGIPVTRDTPPTFIVHAVDDTVDPVEYSLLYFAALKKAAVPVEIHLFAQGGHAFALRPSDLPVSHWTDLADTWLESIGMLQK